MADKLAGLHPDLVARVERVLAAMAANGTPMRVTDGFRSAAQQALLYAKGRTAPGRIVTYADGLHKKSNHQSGRAVDCAFLGPKPYDESHPWGFYGDCAEREGLTWGGRWRSPKTDRPHVELASKD